MKTVSRPLNTDMFPSFSRRFLIAPCNIDIFADFHTDFVIRNELTALQFWRKSIFINVFAFFVAVASRIALKLLWEVLGWLPSIVLDNKSVSTHSVKRSSSVA